MVLSSRRPGRNSKLQQIPLSEILRQGSFLFQAEGLALFRAKGSIPIGRGGHARAFFPFIPHISFEIHKLLKGGIRVLDNLQGHTSKEHEILWHGSSGVHPVSIVHASPVHGLRAIMDLGVISITFTSGISNCFFSIVWIFWFVPLFSIGYDFAKIYKTP